MTILSEEMQTKLETEANIWLAGVRPDGRPHLTPVWFVKYKDNLYVCIRSNSVKANNLRRNRRVSLALEDGSKPIICEGQARFLPLPWPEAVVARFNAKYEWNIQQDNDYDTLLEISPAKWLAW